MTATALSGRPGALKAKLTLSHGCDTAPKWLGNGSIRRTQPVTSGYAVAMPQPLPIPPATIYPSDDSEATVVYDFPAHAVIIEVSKGPGALIVSQLTVAAVNWINDPLTPELLAAIDLSRLFKSAVDAVTVRSTRQRVVGPRTESPDKRAGPKRRAMTPELLGEVAKVYVACATGAPTLAVAEHFGVPHRTATRWVAVARKNKLLADYTKGTP